MNDLLSNLDQINPDIWIKNESSLKENLLNLQSWAKIPLINCNALHNLADNSLVRYRGMIQDMHNPEFYFEQFEIHNSASNEIRIKSGKYRDTADIGENEKLNYTTNLQSSQRQPLVVVSMPGLNGWAQSIEESLNRLPHLEHHQPNTSKRTSIDGSVKLKRSFEERSAEDCVNSEGMDLGEVTANNKEAKFKEKEVIPNMTVSREHILNFPIPDVHSQSCLVKVYTEADNLKLNDMIEVVGFLSVDPSLSGEFCSNTKNAVDDNEMDVETITHNPPPSLVPRLHAVHVRKLEHCNPLVTEDIDQDQVLSEANVAREHLQRTLTELLLGDSLAADYLICHLISCVYLRQDTLTLGQFTLNLSNIPILKYPNYTKQLYNILQQFLTKSYYLPLTLENMNNLAFLPKKDYECNRLTSGLLQLSKDTHLVLDETQLQQGRLDNTGVHNLAALGNLIKTQKVEYDFKYYKMNFEGDIPVLVLSEGKSLLPCEAHLPINPDEASMSIFNEIVEAATHYLKPDVLNSIRVYLTNMKRIEYNISEDCQFVQDDFIAMRNNSTPETAPTAEDLHQLLVLARLVSLSRGYSTLNKDCWDIAKKMEEERQQRIKNRIPVRVS